jgi:hypothetical protein
MTHAFVQHQSQSNTQTQCNKPIPEVITISDSDDEVENQVTKSVKKDHTSSSGTSTTASSVAPTIKQSTPNINGLASGSSSTGVRNISSGCPSVMPITPLLSLARERGQEECYAVQGTSSQSTPNCASRSGVPSCVTVNGDSDEDFQAQQNIAASHERTPIKQPLTPLKCELPTPSNGAAASLSSSSVGIQSKKNRLLAKAQSEWMLSSLKEEHEASTGYENSPNCLTGSANFANTTSSVLALSSSSVNTSPLRMYESYSRNSIAAPPSVLDDKNLVLQGRYSNTIQRQQQAQEILEQKILRERERELEIQAAREREREREREYAIAIATHRERERERDRERERERELSNFRGAVELHQGPPLAHQGDYPYVNTSSAAAAVINQAAQQAAQAQHAAAIHHHQVAAVNHHSAVGARVEYAAIQPPVAHSQTATAAPGAPAQTADILTVHRDFYAAAAAAAAAQPAVYVTTAAGYQQIAIPPPPPAHHSRHAAAAAAAAVLAPPSAHPLPAHMQPAAAAAAAAALFPTHQMAAAAAAPPYGYAPLSPGKTRYLY